MKWIIKYCLIFIFHCVPFLTSANQPDSIFGKADSLYKQGMFLEAGIEYEYIYFFSTTSDIKTLAQLKRVDCFTQRNEFEKAQKYAERISIINKSDSVAFKVRYNRMLNAYLAGNFNEAKSHYVQIGFFHNNIQEPHAKIIYILTLNELNDWKNAKEELIALISELKLSDSQKDSLKQTVNEIYMKKNIPKLKSVDRARLFSTFLPGSGQVYAGYPVEGIFNLSIHLATLTFAATEILAGYYATGYFGGFGLFQKFYFGGIQRVEFLTEKKNYIKSQEFNLQCKDFILQFSE